MVFVAALSGFVGVLILRRRGVYFSLLTLALAALAYTIAFRWTEVTGGEDGLGGLQRGKIGPIVLDDARVFYAAVALIGLGVLYALLRVPPPFGHVWSPSVTTSSARRSRGIRSKVTSSAPSSCRRS